MIASFGAVVCITTRRLVKHETGRLQQVQLCDLIDVQHEHNLVRWDNLVCSLRNGTVERVGIYDQVSCGLFCDELARVMTR